MIIRRACCALMQKGHVQLPMHALSVNSWLHLPHVIIVPTCSRLALACFLMSAGKVLPLGFCRRL